MSYSDNNIRKDRRGLRLGMSWLFSILALLFLTIFFALLIFKATVNISTVAEAVEQIEVTEIRLGSMAELFGNSKVTEDTSLGEAIVITAADEMGIDVSDQDVDKLLNDEDFSESVQEAYSDIVNMATGDTDIEEISDDIVDILKDNTDLIEDITGHDLSAIDFDEAADVVNSYIDVNKESLMDSIGISDNNTDNDNTENSSEEDNTENKYSLWNEDSKESGNSLSISAIIGANDESGAFSKVLSLPDMISNAAVYAFLGLGIICLGLVIFFNRYKLATGFRFDAIILIIVGGFESLTGYIFRNAVNIIDGGISFAGIDELLNSIGDIWDILGKVINAVTTDISNKILMFSLPMLGAGAVLLIVSIIISCVRRKRVKH